MRVLSWNVGHNQGIWQTLEELRSQEQFDVALLQEATAPTESQVSRGVTPDQLDVKRWRTEISGHPRPWRTAVAWWGPLDVQPIESAPLAQVSEDDLERLPESYPGAFTAVRIGDLKLVSLYGVWEHLPGAGGSYSLASVPRAISDLTRLWFGETNPQIAIAGDWNVWHSYGDAPAWDVRQWSSRSDTVFARMEAEGLHLAGPFGQSALAACPCGPRDDCRHVQTYWHQHKEGATPYQTDYVAATAAVEISAPAVVTHLHAEPLWNGLSDHAALVFDIG